MSTNGRQNLWKDMLLDVQQRTSYWLKKIHKQINESCDSSGGDNTNECSFSSVSDEKFQQMFFHAINNRLIDTYSMVEWELKMSSYGLNISDVNSSDSDNNGQGSSSSSNNDNSAIGPQVNDNSNVSVMAVDLLPKEEIKRNFMDDDLPIIEFENPDIVKAKAMYGNKRKKFPKKGYKCSMCKYVAKRKWLLALHRQRHFTEKPYKCRICHKRYSSRSKSKLHTSKHAK